MTPVPEQSSVQGKKFYIMIILSIETSCDETAVSVAEASGGLDSPIFSVLGNALFSQTDIHKEYGGVFPMLAKREHVKNLPHLLKKVLTNAELFKQGERSYDENTWKEIEKITEREEGLYKGFRDLFEQIARPQIDIISVTSGPGLEPALWVGISFALALGKLWNIPVIPTNHMEGHVASILIENEDKRPVKFPALALLISGGHTELVEINNWGKYKVIGETRDDAVGEAFDKVARMMELPYPGGPQISALAEIALTNTYQTQTDAEKIRLPRPMIHSHDFNFSFSGLKTAVLYYIRDNFAGDASKMTTEEKADVAREFEDAVIDVLGSKTEKALEETRAKTLIIGGGVIANKRLREKFEEFEKKYNGLVVKIPTRALATDNALMIACATYINISLYPELLKTQQKIIAKGNLKL